jgi:hypothetical protein
MLLVVQSDASRPQVDSFPKSVQLRVSRTRIEMKLMYNVLRYGTIVRARAVGLEVNSCIKKDATKRVPIVQSNVDQITVSLRYDHGNPSRPKAHS